MSAFPEGSTRAWRPGRGRALLASRFPLAEANSSLVRLPLTGTFPFSITSTSANIVLPPMARAGM